MALTLLILAWLLTYLVHSTILLGGGWVLTATRVVRSPAARDTLWKVCLVGGILTASVYSLSPYQPYAPHLLLPSVTAPAAPAGAGGVSLPIAAAASRTVTRSAASSREWRPAPAAAEPAPLAAPAIERSSRAPLWPRGLVGLWALGAAVMLVRLSVLRLRLQRSLGRRRAIEDGPLTAMLDALRASAGIRARPRLTASTELAGPVAIGVSEICLPERALTALDAGQQRAVLAHELGHIVRRDPVWLGLAVACENVLFFQPLNRLARRRIQEAAEYLCDDWAVHQTGGNLTLAKCLAEVAGWMDVGPRVVPVAGMAENRSQLVDRVHRLLEGVQPARRGLAYAVPVAALALASMAFAAPGVSPPCDQADAPASSALAARQGPDHAWATIRDGRVVTFRDGFAPRFTGQGHLGIRRGGRMIELAEGQRLLVNGREPDGDAVVQVCATDSLQIVDADGRTLWRIAPVRVPASAEAGEAYAGSDTATAGAERDAARAWDRGDSLDRFDTALDKLDTLDVADAAEIARNAAEISRRAVEMSAGVSGEVTSGVLANVMPQVAELQEMGVRLGAELAPRVAGISAKIVGEVVPGILQSICDGGLCDDSVPRVKRHKVLVKPSRP